ncbi:hypothetical protein MUY27_19845 [Mucilaginibacter sp. RS28]|uniref:Lipoprotein n=1 Tax=Mucilaginibacter straminoryzae TaxID=2932774 RepID=A0A9X2BB22_9SPHI|nr:hypothetical protein [Mucilaginibacter straminoryzae]MCJ8211981.1 hypothetical protein [Mucilaginibacter straminoryzae]
MQIRNITVLAALFLAACGHAKKTYLLADSASADSPNVSAAKENPVTADKLIVPGERIGGTHLNENVDSVILRLGKPDKSDAAMGSAMATWLSKEPNSPYQTDIYSHRNMGAADENIARVKIIRVTSPWFKTEERLGVGSTLPQVEDHFKTKQAIVYANGKDTLRIYDDRSKGIGFEMNNSGKCTGVLIHTKGDSTAAYISMHPDMKRVQ